MKTIKSALIFLIAISLCLPHNIAFATQQLLNDINIETNSIESMDIKDEDTKPDISIEGSVPEPQKHLSDEDISTGETLEETISPKVLCSLFAEYGFEQNYEIAVNGPTEYIFTDMIYNYVVATPNDIFSIRDPELQILSVIWNTEDGMLPEEIDTAQATEYTFIGTLIPPEGYSFSETLSVPEVILQIKVLESLQKVTLESLDGTKQFELICGESVMIGDESYQEILKRISYYAKNTYDIKEGVPLDSVWNFDAVDINAPGDYPAYVTFSIREYRGNQDRYILSEDFISEINIHVADPNKLQFRLSGAVDGLFYGKWWKPENSENPSLWYSVSEKELSSTELSQEIFTQDTNEDIFWIDDSETFSIFTYGLNKDLHYYFYMQSGDLTSEYLYLSPGMQNLNIDYIEGDRDGGDGNGNQLPDIIQPPPSGNGGSGSIGSSRPSDDKEDPLPPIENDVVDKEQIVPIPPVIVGNQGDFLQTGNNNIEIKDNISVNSKDDMFENVQRPLITLPVIDQDQKEIEPKQPDKVSYSTNTSEMFGKTKNQILGIRLRMMLEDNGVAQFSKQGILLTLSKSALSSLDFADSDEFEILIQKHSDTAFSAKITQNNKNISELVETTLMVPYKSVNENPEVWLLDEGGNEVAQGIYDSELSVVSFTINHLGDFFISEKMQSIKNISDSSIQNNRSIDPVQSKSKVPAVAIPVALCTMGGVGFVLFKRRKA